MKQKQGPLSAQCLSDIISTRTEQEMESLFNRMVQWLAQRGFLRGKLLVTLDGRPRDLRGAASANTRAG